MSHDAPDAPVTVDDLGLAPTVHQVDDWLARVAHYTRYVAGKSLQGRDLHIYSSQPLETRSEHDPLVLFLSLVHGNEPAGLLSLLRAVEQLGQATGSDKRSLRGYGSYDFDSVTIIVFPIVNIDSYSANLEFGNGCRRTNMRQTCPNETQTVFACPEPSLGGVDLNRNHPMDWNGTYAGDDDLAGPCGITFKGDEAWSEPEAMAIRDVVINYRPTAAMSFHTRGLVQSQALLIHPYTSSRPIEELHNLHLYRRWSRKLNDRNLYVTGTAQEAIKYTASGSTIDWMASQGVISFVMESRTPCREGRWCPAEFTSAVREITEQDGRTGTLLVDLVAALKADHQAPLPYSVLFVRAAIVTLLLVMARWLRMRLQLSWRQSLQPARKRR